VKELVGELQMLSEFARCSGNDDSLQTRILASAAEPFASLRSLWRQVLFASSAGAYGTITLSVC
jgi:hypothetical protein